MLLRTKLITVCILVVFTIKGYSQISERDSLENLLSSAKNEEKLKLLFQLSDLTSDTNDGLKYANDAVGVAKKIGERSLADAYDNLGLVYYYQDQTIKALDNFKKALDLSDKIDYHKGTLNALNRISQIYYYLDSLEQSKFYSNKLLSKSTEVDSVKYQAEAVYQLGMIQKKLNNVDSSLCYMNKALLLHQKIDNKVGVADVYNQLGQLYYIVADYPKSIEFYLKEIKIKEQFSDPYNLAIAYYNFGNTYARIGNYQQALEQYQQALTTFEKINNKEGIALSCSGIGVVYENLSQSALAIKENENNYNKALEYYQRALGLFKEMGARSEEGSSIQNIANVHSRLATNQFVATYGEEWEDSISHLSTNVILSSFGNAIDSYNQALKIFEETDNESEIAKANINLGTTYSWARNWKRADKYLKDGLRIARKLNSPYDISTALYALGESSLRQGLINTAEEEFLECAKLSSELGLKENLRYCYDRLSKLYEQKENVAMAFFYHKMSVKIKDEIFSEKSQKIITEMQTKYETEKKEQENKLLKNEAELQESVIQKQKMMIAGAIVGAILILMVALLMFKMFRDKQKANLILEEKNNLITRQKQEITDSIKYASRIQKAVLPSSVFINDALPEHFVLFMPRDIVSGDFYWMTRKNDKIVLVAADCTGHGVPGAFMSMLGVSFLYEIVNKENVLKPSEILNRLRNHIKTTLSQTGKFDEQKDGMDISLCVIDKEGMRLEWAGAYNPLYQIRNGELSEYKADKMPVAVHLNDHMSFTNHEVEIQPGDTFYMFSDGYSDQFGGTDGRKFMSKKFKGLLTTIYDKSMEDQRDILQSAHFDWKGDHDQVDDILVVGFRI
ncbi:MAG: tetratricopeptide repeat protein [Bacteroidales bacterium]